MKTDLGGLRVKFDQEEGLLRPGEELEVSHIGGVSSETSITSGPPSAR